TGTMSYTLDNVSAGIEPVFSYEQERDILDAHGKRTEVVQDYGVRGFGIKGKRSSEVTIDEHLNVLATATKYVDSAVSKTCNVSPKMPWDEFKQVYIKAYNMGCKGITTFNPEGKRFGVLRSADKPSFKELEQLFDKSVQDRMNQEESPTACEWDPVSGRKSCE